MKNRARYPSSRPSPIGRRNAAPPLRRGNRFFHMLESGNPASATLAAHALSARRACARWAVASIAGRSWCESFARSLALIRASPLSGQGAHPPFSTDPWRRWRNKMKPPPRSGLCESAQSYTSLRTECSGEKFQLKGGNPSEADRLISPKAPKQIDLLGSYGAQQRDDVMDLGVGVCSRFGGKANTEGAGSLDGFCESGFCSRVDAFSALGVMRKEAK